MARRADVMTLRDAASLSRRAVVYRTRFAENKVLGDLDGHDVRAQDVELDGQKEFFENTCYSVSSGLQSHRLKKNRRLFTAHIIRSKKKTRRLFTAHIIRSKKKKRRKKGHYSKA